jgi:hypothetical protein
MKIILVTKIDRARSAGWGAHHEPAAAAPLGR